MPVISVFKRSLTKKEFYFYFFHQASCRKDQFTVSILNLVLKFLLIQVTKDLADPNWFLGVVFPRSTVWFFQDPRTRLLTRAPLLVEHGQWRPSKNGFKLGYNISTYQVRFPEVHCLSSLVDMSSSMNLYRARLPTGR